MNGTKDSSVFDFHPAIICHPTTRLTNIRRFQRYVEERYSIHFENYFKLHEWSIEKFPDFWDCIWNYFKIISSAPYTEVFDKTRSFHNMQWFSGARLNYAENLLRYRDSHLAIHATNENGDTEKITYSQLYDEVAVYAAALKALNVKKGDRVTCFMSNRKEAVFAFLATASIGAIWSGSLPIFGPRPVITRLGQISPKVLFTVDRFVSDGEEVDMLSKLSEIEKGLPTLEKIIVVPSKKAQLQDGLHIPKSCWLKDFLELSPPDPILKFEQLPFDHPLTISYTSGTTGLPKALVHSAGSFLSALKDFNLHHNCTRDEVILHISPVGWISWNLFTNALHLGLTLCLYEGSPYYLTPTAFWDIVEKFEITYIFLPSSILEDFRRKSYLPNDSHSLKKVRFIGASCSPVKPQLYDFVSDIFMKKNPNIFFTSIYGCTEGMGFISGIDLNLPTHRGEIQCVALGVDAKCIDEEGNYVIGKRGDLVFDTPIPSLPLCLYNDDDKKNKLSSSYLSMYPGKWNVNDECWINPVTHGIVVLGRSDEAMKPNGERFNSSDIYAVIDNIAEVEDCLCVSQVTHDIDERVILFVKMARNYKFTKELEEYIRNHICENLTPDYVPSIVLEAPEIPYNFTGKKMELLVKKIINKKVAPNKEVLINPSSIDFYEKIPALEIY